jgi:hypothetical protein
MGVILGFIWGIEGARTLRTQGQIREILVRFVSIRTKDNEGVDEYIRARHDSPLLWFANFGTVEPAVWMMLFLLVVMTTQLPELH